MPQTGDCSRAFAVAPGASGLIIEISQVVGQ
jgi:hypothetical protein